MHFGSNGYVGETNSALGKPQLAQPADPLTDRIQKALSEVSSILMGAEDDLNSVHGRLFGLRPEKGQGEDPVPTPNGADEAIAQSLTFVTFQAMRVRQLAAEMNGRI